MNKMYQLFVSSTYGDLIEIRNIACQTILEMGQVPIGYHDIASDKNVQETIFPLIKNCEIFILIIGERYGGLTKNGLSYVEEEYNYAKSIGKPVLCFIRNDYRKNDDPKFQSFIREILSNHLVSLWDNEGDFKGKLTTSIYTLLSKSAPDTYWLRHSKKRKTDESEIDKYYNDVVDAIGLSSTSSDDNDILGLMALNLKELKEFYTLTKKQAIRSFTLSVCMCIAGFLLITFASTIALLWKENQIAIATAIGGTIVEVIAGTSLFVYRKSLEQLNFYYLSLHDNERFMSLINISSKTSIKEDLFSKIVVSELERLGHTTMSERNEKVQNRGETP